MGWSVGARNRGVGDTEEVGNVAQRQEAGAQAQRRLRMEGTSTAARVRAAASRTAPAAVIQE